MCPYQRLVARAFNKKVKPRYIIKVGDMVLKVIRWHVSDLRGEFKPNWEGPYFVKRILSGGAAYIADLDGMEFVSLVNIDKLKKYYPREMLVRLKTTRVGGLRQKLKQPARLETCKDNLGKKLKAFKYRAS